MYPTMQVCVFPSPRNVLVATNKSKVGEPTLALLLTYVWRLFEIVWLQSGLLQPNFGLLVAMNHMINPFNYELSFD